MTVSRQLTRISIGEIIFEPAPVSKARQTSLLELGQVDPIRVRPSEDGRYEIINGRRRVANLVANGAKEVEVIIDHVTDEDADWQALALNMSGSPSPMVEARIIGKMVDRDYTQKEIARRLGITQGNVSQRLSLLALIPELQGQLETSQITLTAARMICKLPEADQVSLLAEEQITVELAKDALRQYQAGEVDLSVIDIPSPPDSGVTIRLTAAQVAALDEGGEVTLTIGGKEFRLSEV